MLLLQLLACHSLRAWSICFFSCDCSAQQSNLYAVSRSTSGKEVATEGPSAVRCPFEGQTVYHLLNGDSIYRFRSHLGWRGHAHAHGMMENTTSRARLLLRRIHGLLLVLGTCDGVMFPPCLSFFESQNHSMQQHDSRHGASSSERMRRGGLPTTSHVLLRHCCHADTTS